MNTLAAEALGLTVGLWLGAVSGWSFRVALDRRETAGERWTGVLVGAAALYLLVRFVPLVWAAIRAGVVS